MEITFIQMGMNIEDSGWKIKKTEEECTNIF